MLSFKVSKKTFGVKQSILSSIYRSRFRSDLWVKREKHIKIGDENTLLVRLQLGKLVKEFNDTALLIGRHIIDEVDVPAKEKSIPPVDVGGIAGGSKFIYGGIFFKFARDENNLFGSDDNAAKAALHEVSELVKCITFYPKN